MDCVCSAELTLAVYSASNLLPFRFAMAIAIEGYCHFSAKTHLSALAVDNHGMTAIAVGGGTFLAYLVICLFLFTKIY
jgi:hypothetical protein